MEPLLQDIEATCFYSTNTTTRQQWVYPRMDKCDGTEPSIAELLAGHDSRNFDYVKQLGGNTQQAMSIDSEVKVGGVSEVGITNGLVAYYPLNKDAKDYSGNGYHGTVTGAVLTGGGLMVRELIGLLTALLTLIFLTQLGIRHL